MIFAASAESMCRPRRPLCDPAHTRRSAQPPYGLPQSRTEATLRSNIARWIITMAIALGMTAVAIIAIDRAVDCYLDGLRAQNIARTHNATSSSVQSWHPAIR